MRWVLFTAMEGTGENTLCYRNFIKPLKEKVFSIVNIRDVLKGNINKGSIYLPVTCGSIYPLPYHLLLIILQTFLPLLFFTGVTRLSKRRIVARGVFSGFLLSLFPWVDYYLLSTGIYQLEALVYSRKKKVKIYRWIEYRALKRAKRVFVPIENIAEYYRENYKVESTVSYIPAYFSDKSINKFSRFTPVYLGTIADDKTIDAILRVFERIKKYERETRLLILSFYLKRGHYKKLKSAGVHIRKVSTEDLPPLLSKCHVGLVMEGENEISPYLLTTKFVDYLSCGLPVIVHKGMEGLCKLVKKWNAGVCIEPKDLSGNHLKRIRSIQGDRLKRIAKEHFSTERFRRLVLSEALKNNKGDLRLLL